MLFLSKGDDRRPDMMFNAGLTKSLRDKLKTECAQTATLLHNVTVNLSRLSKQVILGHKYCPYTVFWFQTKIYQRSKTIWRNWYEYQ